MRLLVAVFTTAAAFAALAILAYVVDATGKSLAFATTSVSDAYQLSAGVAYAASVDKYGFLTVAKSGAPGGSYAQLVVNLPSGWALLAEPGTKGNLLCAYVADPSRSLLQRCAFYANATKIYAPVYYLKPGYTYYLEPGTWRLAAVRDPHSVWMPPPELFLLLVVVLFVAAVAWRYYR